MAELLASQDENPGIAASLMKKRGFSFPFICGGGIAQKFVPGGGYPLEVLIDPQGRRLQRHTPRASDETIASIEEMADQLATVKWPRRRAHFLVVFASQGNGRRDDCDRVERK